MASPLKNKSAREFCATCGWPGASGQRCEACGSDGVAVPLSDAAGRAPLRAPAGADDVVRQAFEAWRARDWSRLVGLCLVAAGGQGPRTASLPDGAGWSFFLHAVPVCVSVHSAAGILSVEAPLVRLPQRQRVAAMRVALELCDRAALVSRVCLRGDLLVVRFVGRLGAVTPPMLRQAIRDVASFAERHGASMEACFDARPPAPEESSRQDAALGRPRALPRLAPPVSRSLAPPPAPPEDAPVSGLESIPPILAPQLAGSPAAPAALPRPAPVPTVGTSGRRATVNGLQVDASPPARRPTIPPPTSESATPAERLCDLLRYAQALATSVSYDDKPETMLLLVRSTVFRAIHEFGESVPDAVSHFYRSTQGAMKEILQSAGPARRRSSMQIPIAEPALLIMQQIVAQRAQMPQEKRLVVDPLTTAADAKAHVARYVDEIERAPVEPQLRHFLALGALAELLVRTKLPQATDQRLREIIAHAHRDAGKAASLELMMKALARIAAS